MSTRAGLVRIGYDMGGVLAAFATMLALENLGVGIWQRAQFVGTWEMAHARMYISPIALGALAPVAALVVGVAVIVTNRRTVLGGLVAFVAGALLAFGISNGRNFANPGLRIAFVAVFGIAAGLAGFLAVRLAPRGRPRTTAAVGLVVAAAAWFGDVFVLPRLYPALHLAFFLIATSAFATTWLVVRGRTASRVLAFVGALVTLASIAWTPRAARAVSGDDNLRRVLLERAPLLGRATLVAAKLAPPRPMDDDGAPVVQRTTGGPRTLDWAGRDIVVVTIDALRADHVGAYGYNRKATPNIDRLAARGARFEHAYCPTPHTSYSIASMMTGKYMRPLLALGVADGSETWAAYMRRYGYRTAAFYPPAVFFIDEHRFRGMKDSSLDFEFKKEEFAPPDLRRKQVEKYLATAPVDRPIFMWVHLFEPHEPYERHPEHDFGEDDVARYDSEVATADALTGDIVAMVEKRRPGAVVIVTADHGEELGDHGGRYHGTTVYEEQVRVPLVVVGPGIAPRVVTTPVQTIDLLPTTLAALDVPLPARIRGRDLGPLATGRGVAKDEGLAFAETDDWTMLARGTDRLVCARKIASCTLFDVGKDPAQTKPVADRPERVEELRKTTAALERENGKVEAADMPDALRRALQGDRDAAEDLAPLLDDARVEIRRAAARAAFGLRDKGIVAQLRRAATKDEDPNVRAWAALAAGRLGEKEDRPLVDPLLKDPDPKLRLGAALVLGELGDKKAEAELVARWNVAFVDPKGVRGSGELDEARELLVAFSKLKARTAVPSLIAMLPDVRLRPYVVDTLKDIGDGRARAPLLAVFAEERYAHLRPKEAQALAALGVREEMRASMSRFAGVPTPMENAVMIAKDAGLLRINEGGWHGNGQAKKVDVTLRIPGAGPARLFVRANGSGPPRVTFAGQEVQLTAVGPDFVAELETAPNKAPLHLEHDEGLLAAWIVRRAEELPPPAPKRWEAPEPSDD